MYHVIFHLPFFHLQRRHRVPLLGSAHGWTFFPFFFPTLRALAFQVCFFLVAFTHRHGTEIRLLARKYGN
jgi:hypothetical protein